METLMLCIRIDHDRLKTEIRALASEGTQVKRVLRAPWHRPMADEQKLLCRLRRKLTELHVLSAWARGRLHVTSPPRPGVQGWDASAHAATIAARLAPDYAAAIVTNGDPTGTEAQP